VGGIRGKDLQPRGILREEGNLIVKITEKPHGFKLKGKQVRNERKKENGYGSETKREVKPAISFRGGTSLTGLKERGKGGLGGVMAGLSITAVKDISVREFVKSNAEEETKKAKRCLDE